MSGVTVSPAGNTFKSATLMTSNVVPKGLRKPRLGMRRCNGICPPSKPRRREYPRRDFCPLLPAPAVLPSLEPMPRPTRTFFLREPAGGCRFASVKERRTLDAGVAGLCWPRLPLPRGPLALFFAIALLHHFHEMTHLVDHAARFRRVLALNYLVHSAQAEAADGLPHVIRAADETDHPLDLHFAAGLLAVVLGPVVRLGRAFFGHNFFDCH